MSIIGHGTAGQGLRQPESAPFDPVAGDLVGLKADNGLCITDYQQGQFYPPVTHYLTDDSALFAWCAEAGCDETINDLEKQVEQSQWQTIQLRDLFAIATLIGEFAGNRGTASAVTFAYTIADHTVNPVLAEKQIKFLGNVLVEMEVYTELEVDRIIKSVLQFRLSICTCFANFLRALVDLRSRRRDVESAEYVRDLENLEPGGCPRIAPVARIARN